MRLGIKYQKKRAFLQYLYGIKEASSMDPSNKLQRVERLNYTKASGEQLDGLAADVSPLALRNNFW